MKRARKLTCAFRMPRKLCSKSARPKQVFPNSQNINSRRRFQKSTNILVWCGSGSKIKRTTRKTKMDIILKFIQDYAGTSSHTSTWKERKSRGPITRVGWTAQDNPTVWASLRAKMAAFSKECLRNRNSIRKGSSFLESAESFSAECGATVNVTDS